MDIKKRTATCHTENCVNAEIPIKDFMAETVVCGCCGEVIEDVK